MKQALLTPYMTLIMDQSTSTRGVNINLHSSSNQTCQVPLHYINQPSSGQSSSLLMKTSCLRLKLVELTSLQVSMLTIRVILTYLTYINIQTSRQDEPFQ